MQIVFLVAWILARFRSDWFSWRLNFYTPCPAPALKLRANTFRTECVLAQNRIGDSLHKSNEWAIPRPPRLLFQAISPQSQNAGVQKSCKTLRRHQYFDGFGNIEPARAKISGDAGCRDLPRDFECPASARADRLARPRLSAGAPVPALPCQIRANKGFEIDPE
jgi:hypothetical protein